MGPVYLKNLVPSDIRSTVVITSGSCLLFSSFLKSCAQNKCTMLYRYLSQLYLLSCSSINFQSGIFATLFICTRMYPLNSMEYHLTTQPLCWNLHCSPLFDSFFSAHPLIPYYSTLHLCRYAPNTSLHPSYAASSAIPALEIGRSRNLRAERAFNSYNNTSEVKKETQRKWLS